MRKYICLLIAAYTVFFSLSCTAMTAGTLFGEYEPSAESFSDMEGYEWASEAAENLNKAGIVSGVGKNMFMPERNVTRREFIKLVCGACAITDCSASSSYTDVLTDDWSYIYVSSAKEAGMLDIYGSQSLEADTVITREDMAYLAVKALEFTGTGLTAGESGLFPDDGEISDYAKKAVYALKSEKIINGRENGGFDPQGCASRAEAVKIIYGIYKIAKANYLQ